MATVEKLIRKALSELKAAPRVKSPSALAYTSASASASEPAYASVRGWEKGLRSGADIAAGGDGVKGVSGAVAVDEVARRQAMKWKLAADATRERGSGPLEARAGLLLAQQREQEEPRNSRRDRYKGRGRSENRMKKVVKGRTCARPTKTYKEHVYESQMGHEISSLARRFAEPSMVLGQRAAAAFRPKDGLNDPTPLNAVAGERDGDVVEAEVLEWREKTRPAGARVKSWRMGAHAAAAQRQSGRGHTSRIAHGEAKREVGGEGGIDGGNDNMQVDVVAQRRPDSRYTLLRHQLQKAAADQKREARHEMRRHHRAARKRARASKDMQDASLGYDGTDDDIVDHTVVHSNENLRDVGTSRDAEHDPGDCTDVSVPTVDYRSFLQSDERRRECNAAPPNVRRPLHAPLDPQLAAETLAHSRADADDWFESPSPISRLASAGSIVSLSSKAGCSRSSSRVASAASSGVHEYIVPITSNFAQKDVEEAEPPDLNPSADARRDAEILSSLPPTPSSTLVAQGDWLQPGLDPKLSAAALEGSCGRGKSGEEAGVDTFGADVMRRSASASPLRSILSRTGHAGAKRTRERRNRGLSVRFGLRVDSPLPLPPPAHRVPELTSPLGSPSALRHAARARTSSMAADALASTSSPLAAQQRQANIQGDNATDPSQGHDQRRGKVTADDAYDVPIKSLQDALRDADHEAKVRVRRQGEARAVRHAAKFNKLSEANAKRGRALRKLERKQAGLRWGAAARTIAAARAEVIAGTGAVRGSDTESSATLQGAYAAQVARAQRNKGGPVLPPPGYRLPEAGEAIIPDKPLWDDDGPQWQPLSNCLSTDKMPAKSLIG